MAVELQSLEARLHRNEGPVGGKGVARRREIKEGKIEDLTSKYE